MEKLASHKSYVSVNPGEEITFTFEVMNANSGSRVVSITDTLPENTEFVAVSGGAERNGALSFSVAVGAGQTASVSYTVRVKEGTYPENAWVSNDAAKANGVSVVCHDLQYAYGR